MAFHIKIISDQGCNFESELIANLCQLAAVQKLRTSPYHPQKMGSVSGLIVPSLTCWAHYPLNRKKDWKTYVPAMVHSYNCTKNASTGYSP